MRQQGGEIREDVVVNERPFGRAVRRALVMFQAGLMQPIAQHDEKMVTLVVASAEQSGILAGYALIGF